jgi:uncharacterized membrane protein
MSYQEKRTLTTLIATVLVYLAYALIAFGRYGLADPLRDWARIMLIFIGVTVIAMILVQILFHIFLSVGISVRETLRDRDVDTDRIDAALQGEFVEDERDKLIALKSRQAGFIISGLGFFAGLIALLLGGPASLMLNILYGAFFLGAVAEGVMNLVIYRRKVSYA